MRIIAGTKRGMKLFSPSASVGRRRDGKTEVSRPITDRVKESLFSVLYKYDLPDGKTAADLFCGVGSLGLEALSRGAEFVTFVERDLKVAEILERNIERTGFVKEESKVIRTNAFKFGALADERRYDVIFVDPPYANTKDIERNSPLGKLLGSVSDKLVENGIVVVRTERRTELLKQYGLLEIIERRQWGTMAITILRKQCELLDERTHSRIYEK